MVVFGSRISWKTWVKSFLPILGRSYWFASSYMLLLLLIPILNRLYEKWNIRLAHILVGTFVFSILPTVTFNGRLLGDHAFAKLVFKLIMFGPIWFSFLYMLIRYLKPWMKMTMSRKGGVEAMLAASLCGFLWLHVFSRNFDVSKRNSGKFVSEKQLFHYPGYVIISVPDSGCESVFPVWHFAHPPKQTD